MDHFTITVPSNDNSLEDNTIGSFEISLPSRLDLVGRWEVGVQGISYTKSWFNVTKDSKLKILRDDGASYVSPRLIKAGHYPNESALVGAIADSLDGMWSYFRRKETTLPAIEFNHITRRVHITTGKNSNFILYLELEEELSEILGLKYDYESEYYDVIEATPDEIKIQHLRIKGEANSFRHYDLSAGVRSIFLYSNIVSNSIVGSKLTSLLKVVPIPSEAHFGDQINLDFNPIEYQKLNTNTLQDISIALFDDTGSQIPFKFGRTIVKLHFRQNESIREILSQPGW